MLRRSEMEMFVNRSNAEHKPALMKGPKVWFFVGSIPSGLCEERENKIGQKFIGSKYFQTEQEALDAYKQVTGNELNGINGGNR